MHVVWGFPGINLMFGGWTKVGSRLAESEPKQEWEFRTCMHLKT